MQKTNVGQALEEDGAGEPYTIFVPRNEALSNMNADKLNYLLSPEVLYPTYTEVEARVELKTMRSIPVLFLACLLLSIDQYKY